MRRQRVEELERDRDALLRSYVGMTPEALDGLVPEERHHVYRMLKLKVSIESDGSLEASGELLGRSRTLVLSEPSSAARRSPRASLRTCCVARH
jgi:hypothetical protein